MLVLVILADVLRPVVDDSGTPPGICTAFVCNLGLGILTQIVQQHSARSHADRRLPETNAITNGQGPGRHCRPQAKSQPFASCWQVWLNMHKQKKKINAAWYGQGFAEEANAAAGELAALRGRPR